MQKHISEHQSIKTFRSDRPDEIFICCASFEERCLGTFRLFNNYQFNHGYVFVDDKASEKKEQYLHEACQIATYSGPYEIISYSEGDPTNSIATFDKNLHQLDLDPKSSVVTLDITTFNKRHLLMLLKYLDEHGFWNSLRVFYTEPYDYVTDLYLPMSTGIKQINPVPGFVNTQPLNKPILLLIFLGYEGDRAMSLFNNLDPNETLLIIPKPAFHEEWEGRTENMNRDLITLLGEEKIKYADSRDPVKVVTALSEILSGNGEHNLQNWGCCISPLGTKPQILGLYLFWREHPTQFSILYAQPLKHNEFFNSTGVGRTWLLISPNQS